MKFFELIPPNMNLDWLKMSKPLAWVSWGMVIASAIGLYYPGLNYGIDFTGGAEVHVKVPSAWDTTKVREAIAAGGLDGSVVSLGEPGAGEFLVKVQAKPEQLMEVSHQVEKSLVARAEGGTVEVKRTDVVGPKAGESLRRGALLSIIYSLIVISVYIAFRFDMRYAPGVLRALMFDVLVTMGVWVLLQKEFNLTVLAAVLMVAGYSCNDTVVIYDRIRDLMKMTPNRPIEEIVNFATNQNLGRTILTTLCTMLTVVCLYTLGGPVLRDFAQPLLIGFTISVPSTLFFATPLLVFMERRRLARLHHGKVPARTAVRA